MIGRMMRQQYHEARTVGRMVTVRNARLFDFAAKLENGEVLTFRVGSLQEAERRARQMIPDGKFKLLVKEPV